VGAAAIDALEPDMFHPTKDGVEIGPSPAGSERGVFQMTSERPDSPALAWFCRCLEHVMFL
jgi:hypothetical protein